MKTLKLKKIIKEIEIEKKQSHAPESITEDELLSKINNFNMFSEDFYSENDSFISKLKEISTIAKLAGQHIIESENDWFAKVSLKRDSTKLNKLSEELNKISDQAAELKKDAIIVFEDIGIALNRYYTIEDLRDNKNKNSKRKI